MRPARQIFLIFLSIHLTVGLAQDQDTSAGSCVQFEQAAVGLQKELDTWKAKVSQGIEREKELSRKIATLEALVPETQAHLDQCKQQHESDKQKAAASEADAQKKISDLSAIIQTNSQSKDATETELLKKNQDLEQQTSKYKQEQEDLQLQLTKLTSRYQELEKQELALKQEITSSAIQSKQTAEQAQSSQSKLLSSIKELQQKNDQLEKALADFKKYESYVLPYWSHSYYNYAEDRAAKALEVAKPYVAMTFEKTVPPAAKFYHKNLHPHITQAYQKTEILVRQASSQMQPHVDALSQKISAQLDHPQVKVVLDKSQEVVQTFRKSFSTVVSHPQIQPHVNKAQQLLSKGKQEVHLILADVDKTAGKFVDHMGIKYPELEPLLNKDVVYSVLMFLLTFPVLMVACSISSICCSSKRKSEESDPEVLTNDFTFNGQRVLSGTRPRRRPSRG